MYINRYINIKDEMKFGKTLVILGPRRVGKTTIINEFINHSKDKNIAFYRGDDISTQNIFEIPDINKIKPYLGSSTILIIDEAQAIPNIGQSLKIINDTMPSISIIVTGSSSFELAGQIGEPLTGRKKTKYLFPISLIELLSQQTIPQNIFEKNLSNYLIYGMYPEAITLNNHQEKIEFLNEIVDSYLLRDILAYRKVKGSRILLQLLVLLAYQVGSEVSYTELGNSLGIDKNTVSRYLDLLEKSYIIFRVGGFSRNLRSEITKNSKYYFYDIGIRNAVINNFNSLEKRDDIGKLWENFIITERLKVRLYKKIYSNQYFWRTWKQNEIDLIEERDGTLFGYEMKWKDKGNISMPKEWSEAYGDSSQWKVISPENALQFLDIT